MILRASVYTLLMSSSGLTSCTGSLAIVVKSSFTTTFLSPVLGFLLFMMDVLVYLLTNGATMALPFVLDLLPALTVVHSLSGPCLKYKRPLSLATFAVIVFVFLFSHSASPDVIWLL